MFAFVNNEFVPAEQASLGINDLSILRGYGVFDFFRTRNNKILFLNDYLDRFYQSAQSMYLQPVLPRNKLEGFVNQLVEKNNLPDSGIRLILTGGYATDGYTLSTPNLILTQQPIKMPSDEMVAKGVKVIMHGYTREMPTVKSINYNMGVWLQHKVKEKNAFDVLYHDKMGISEFPRANVFIVNADGKVVTPAKNVLMGVTRKKVIDIASEYGSIEERAITLEELKSASEVFITSTTRRLLPVCKIDEKIIGSGNAGPVFTKLYHSFIKLEEKLSGLL